MPEKASPAGKKRHILLPCQMPPGGFGKASIDLRFFV